MDSHKARGEKIGLIPVKFKGVKSDAMSFLTTLVNYAVANHSIYNNNENTLSLGPHVRHPETSRFLTWLENLHGALPVRDGGPSERSRGRVKRPRGLRLGWKDPSSLSCKAMSKTPMVGDAHGQPRGRGWLPGRRSTCQAQRKTVSQV